MAIIFYTGIPRSGKSYKAVNFIYDNFVQKKITIIHKLLLKLKLKKPFENPFENCYTNINQFNFSISDKLIPFDFQEFYIKIESLYNLYLAKKTDFELIEESKKLNLYKSLFVIDEAQTYFKNKENPILIWWFTYHAHLHQNIILITQDLKLLNDEYKRIGESFYKAIPQRYRLSKNTFRYRSYSSYNMYQKDYINTETLKANKEVFGLYISGAKVTTTPIIYKYIIIFVLVALMMVYFFINYMNSLSSQKQEIKQENNNTPILLNENQQINNNTPISLNQNEEINNNKELKLFKFNCFNVFCYYQFPDKTLFEIPQNILTTYLKDIEIDKKFLSLKDKKLMIYVLVPQEKFNFITQGVINENKKQGNDTVLPNIGLN